MTDAPASEALDPRRAAHLTDFARGCSAAARAVSLYPAGHPAVETAVTRLIETAGRVTAAEAFRLTVLPDGLLLDRLAPAQPDQAVPEFARLLHQHLISGFVLHDGGDAKTWHTLLGLLARPPEEVREAGGIGHLWSDKGGLTTEDHRRSIELREVDYERLLLSRALGDPATLEQIFDSLVAGELGNLDPTARSMLGEIIRDTDKLELFTAELLEHIGPDGGSQAEALSHLLRSATELTAGDEDVLRDEAMGNLAKLLTGLNAETMADLLRRRGTPAAMAGGQDAVQAVTERMASEDVATFVSGSIAAENAASHRLAEAFQALVPDLDDRRQMVSLVGEQLAESPFGQTDAFPDIWKQAETLLTSYSDEQFVGDQYARELDVARTQATEVDNISDDPKERIDSWLATISNPALRALDLQLLLDLLDVEREPFRWRDIAGTVCRSIEDLTLSGDLQRALKLLDSIARRRPDDAAPVEADSIGSFAREAIDRVAAGPAMRHAVARLRTGRGTAAHRRRDRRDTGETAVRHARPRHRDVFGRGARLRAGRQNPTDRAGHPGRLRRPRPGRRPSAPARARLGGAANRRVPAQGVRRQRGARRAPTPAHRCRAAGATRSAARNGQSGR